MGKLLSIFNLFREGSSVANPELWKKGGSALQLALIPFFYALSKAVCELTLICITLSAETVTAIATGVVAIVGVCINYITSDKVGLPGLKPTPPVAGEAGDGPASGQGSLDLQVGSEPAKSVSPMDVRLKPPSNQEDAG